MPISQRFKELNDLGLFPEEAAAPVERVGALEKYASAQAQAAIDEVMAPVMAPVYSAMMTPARLPEDPSEVRLAKEANARGVGTSIVHELVKSFGIRHDFETDTWSWNAENVKKSWNESKFWTALDWATVLASPLKLGVMAAKAARAGSVSSRVLEAAKGGSTAAKTILEGAKPRGLAGRALALFNEDLARAAVVEGRVGASKGRFAKIFRSPLSDMQRRGLEPIMKELGVVDPGNTRGLANLYLNGARAKQALAETKLAAAAKGLEGARKALGPERWDEMAATWDHAVAAKSLEEGQSMLAAYGKSAQEAYAKTWDLRHHFAERMAHAGMGEAGQLSLFGKGARGAAGPLDPMQSLTAFWKDTQELIKREAIDGLANSAVGWKPADLARRMADWSDDVFRANGVDPALREVARAAGGNPEAAEALVRGMGWRRMTELKLGAKAKYADTWIDPAAADEISEFFKIHDDVGRLGELMKGYYRGMRIFRASKTAWNPGTFMVNYFGNIPFYSFATGRMKLAPVKAARLLARAGDGKATKAELGTLQRAMEHMVLDSNEMAGVNRIIKEGGEIGGSSVTPLFRALGVQDKAFFKQLDGLASAAEAGYRRLDDWWKLEAFMDLEARTLKSLGKTAATASADELAEAGAYAGEQIMKGMPMFNRMSPAAELMGRAIPFSNFTEEAVRVWKNTIMEKPHLAFLWSHLFTTASIAATIPAGISPDEYAAMKGGLPGHMQNKPHLLIPLRIDGEVEVLDTSWLLPLGTNFAGLGQKDRSEGLFGGIGHFLDITANPVVGLISAAITGKDPFSGQDLDAPMTQQTVGRFVPGAGTGRAAGLVEYALAAALPPLVPPGYAGKNIVESALGLRGRDDQPLERDVATTVLANVARFKTYRYSELQQHYSVKRIQQELQSSVNSAWKYHDAAVTNNMPVQKEWARGRIQSLAGQLGEDPQAFYLKGLAERTSGAFKGATKESVRGVVVKSRRAPAPVSKARQEERRKLERSVYERFGR